jgi:endonuclease YncB( thermonuclease family)
LSFHGIAREFTEKQPPDNLVGDESAAASCYSEAMIGRLLVLFMLLLPAAAPAAVLEGLTPGGDGMVENVVDGDTLVLESGLEVRLVGIQAPKLPLGRPHVRLQPLAAEAKARLEKLTLGRPVALAYGGQRRDRYGRALAHLEADGKWVQGELLRAGLARVYSFRDNRARVAEMLALEQQARRARLGIWGHRFYRLLQADDTRGALDEFQIVEGRVLTVAVVRGRAYLNFGQDWRRDFTVTIAPKDRRGFVKAGFDPKSYAQRRIRVRGWLYWRNGPMIEATHPEQIEVIEE